MNLTSIDLEQISNKECEQLGNLLSEKLTAGQLAFVLTGIIVRQGAQGVRSRLIEAAQYLGAIDRGGVINGHKQMTG